MSGRAVLFDIYYFLLHAFFTHYYLPPGYVGALRSNINKTKRVNSENLHYFGVYTAAMGFTSDACWVLLIETLLIKNNKKREAALKNEADGDEKRVFFLLGLRLLALLFYERYAPR